MQISVVLQQIHLKSEKKTHCTGCNVNPCLNGGTCVESTGTEFICTCPEGFTGEICESDVCDSHQCKNGGDCVADQSVIRGYMCSCITGFVGENCEVGVCDNHDCMNGGFCEVDKSSVRGYTCKCTSGYIGDNCEVGICDNHGCMNDGSCEADESSARGYTCNCVAGYVGENCEVLPIDCKVYRDNGNSESGVYSIYPFGPGSDPVKTYCDMETFDGGWTAIQRRVDGSVSFDRNWTEYKNGFGAVERSFWIGNDVINQLTKGNGSSLYISVTLMDGRTLTEMYHRFYISDEAENYQLFLGGSATGLLGDAMLNTVESEANLSGMDFSTIDRDKDRRGSSCAELHRGGWWFNAYYRAFLSGPWSQREWGIPWEFTILSGRDIIETQMLVIRHKTYKV